MPNSSRNSRTRHASKVSFGSRLPPGNSHKPPRCASGVPLGDEQLSVAEDQGRGNVNGGHGNQGIGDWF